MKTRTPETTWTHPPQGAARDIDVEATLTGGAKRVIKVRASTNAIAFHLAGQILHHEEPCEVIEMRILLPTKIEPDPHYFSQGVDLTQFIIKGTTS